MVSYHFFLMTFSQDSSYLQHDLRGNLYDSLATTPIDAGIEHRRIADRPFISPGDRHAEGTCTNSVCVCKSCMTLVRSPSVEVS